MSVSSNYHDTMFNMSTSCQQHPHRLEFREVKSLLAAADRLASGRNSAFRCAHRMATSDPANPGPRPPGSVVRGHPAPLVGCRSGAEAAQLALARLLLVFRFFFWSVH